MKQGELGEKLDRLEPLSAGVVFAREEAWQRLNQQMDQPKKRRRLALYVGAAAAVLVLSITLLLQYSQNATNTVQYKNNVVKQINPTLPETSVSEYPAIQSVPPVVKASGITTTAIQRKKHYPTLPAPIHKFEVITPATIAPNVPDATNLPPAATAAPVYAVVSINELDNETPPANLVQQPDANKNTITFNRMQVIHIRDIQRSEFNLKLVQPEPKNLFEVMTFSRTRKYSGVDATPGFLRVKIGNR
jgi:hypothetical protein